MKLLIILKVIRKFNKFIKILYVILHDIFFLKSIKKSNFLDCNETLDFLLKNNSSFIRWGDAESQLVFGIDVYYQKVDKDLQDYLYKILKDYKYGTNYLLALPNMYLEKSFYQLLRIGKFNTWLSTKYLFWKYCDLNKTYGEAFIFRKNEPLSKEQISKLWITVKNIIFIHPEEKVFNDFKLEYPDNNVFYINVKSENAFFNLKQTLNNVLNIISINKIEATSLKILISAGPTADILIYELSAMGYICYDMGHFFKLKFYGIKDKDYK